MRYCRLHVQLLDPALHKCNEIAGGDFCADPSTHVLHSVSLAILELNFKVLHNLRPGSVSTEQLQETCYATKVRDVDDDETSRRQTVALSSTWRFTRTSLVVVLPTAALVLYVVYFKRHFPRVVFNPK